MGREERADELRCFGQLVFEDEVAGVEQMEFNVGVVLAVGLCAFDGEEGVVLAPDDQRGGLLGFEIIVPPGVEGDVASVILEQGELDLGVAGAIEQGLVGDPVAGIDARRIGSLREGTGTWWFPG